MNRRMFWLIILILAVAGFWFWWSTWSVLPTLTITAPAGGETWQSGEDHTISWSARGAPTSDKISVTIRRIPPPPLPEEGQEFDPIIFTDLPNTGSKNWKISPMYPNGIYRIGISAYKSLPITSEISAESGQFKIVHPNISEDLFPLYGGVNWNASEAESFEIGTSTYSGASITSYAVTDIMNPGGVFTPFENYYEQKLKALGWKAANNLAAGGHVGGQNGYRKSSGVILTRFHVDYRVNPSNAPSECPCDVTLSLFSSE